MSSGATGLGWGSLRRATLPDDDDADALIEDDMDAFEATLNNGRILNQDEIDSLMGFDRLEPTDAAPDEPGDQSLGLQAVVNSGLVSYDRLPMLEIVFDRMVRLMSASLRGMTAGSADVEIEAITSVRFSEFSDQIPMPTLISVFRAQEWDSSGLVVLGSDLIYALVDLLLGGRRGGGVAEVDGRPFTTLERRLVERFVRLMLSDLGEAFRPLTDVTFELERVETNPRFAAVDRPSNAAVLVTIRIDFDRRGGTATVLLPYATLEPIRELLVQMFMGEKFGRDAIWEEHLAREIMATRVDLEAVLDETSLALSSVRSLAVGDTLVFDKSPDQLVVLRSGGVTLFAGSLGQQNGRIAVAIDRVLRHAPQNERGSSPVGPKAEA